MKRNEIRALITKYKEKEKEINNYYKDKLYNIDFRIAKKRDIAQNNEFISDLEKLL